MPVNPISLANLRPCSSTHQPKHRTPRGPSILTPLKRLLSKKITYEDPETKQMVTGKVQEVIAIRHILNATQGDHNAITDILDRIDGKVPNGDKKSEVRIYNVIYGHRAYKSDANAVRNNERDSKPA